ncbi:MAG: hypothetical protein MUC48_22495 [Leptolyngbya sp. Prado105]|jgi:hypothetical protein|nr:hypothetical protein [Leptolyngbya sp. Prado105]
MYDDMAAVRRNDPNFAQVSGYIPKEMALQFKIACTAKEISMTEGLEQAVSLWLEKNAHDKTPVSKNRDE